MIRDYPPILEKGFHDLTIKEVEALFATNEHRKIVWHGFKKILQTIDSFKFNYEIWVDGSFITKKPNPKDIDFVIFVTYNDINKFTPECSSFICDIVSHANKDDIKQRYFCDIYFTVTENQDSKDYWIKQFGTSRQNEEKGIAVIKVTEHG